MPKLNPPYVYVGNIQRIKDGDTVVLDLDLGMRLRANPLTCRLFGINSPEKRGATKEAGLAAQAHLQDLINKYGCWSDKFECQQLLIRTYRDHEFEKFGRYLAELIGHEKLTEDTLGQEVILNKRMVKDGHAVPYMDDLALHGMLYSNYFETTLATPQVLDDYEGARCIDCFNEEFRCRCSPGE